VSSVTKGIKKIGKTVGGAISGIFKAPKVVVEDNSQQVADAINQKAEDEKAAKAEAELKEQQEKEYREMVEKDQKELDNLKAAGTSDTTESDLASSGLNDVNADFSKTLREDEEEKKRRSDALLNALTPRR
jgi:cell shape-determining protein MreC